MFGALLVPLGLVVLLLAAYAVDRARAAGDVGRNVEVAGIELDGMSRAEVEAVAAELSADVADDEVVLSTGDALLPTTVGALGASLDGPALAERAADVRGGGPILTRPARWIASFFSTEELEPTYVVDEEVATAEVLRLAEDGLARPVEPTLVVDDGQLQAVEGTPGQRLDPAQVVAELPAVLAGPAPHVVDVDPLPLEPEGDLAALRAVADDANAVVTGPLVVTVEDQQITLETEELRSFLRLDDEGTGWLLDGEAIDEALRPRFTGLGGPEQRARFDVVDGTPVILPASQAVVCCAEDSAQRITDALRAGAGEVALATTTIEDDGVAELEALGIVEEVSSFTTNHACCENRVRNIQRFADIVRGTIIPPGGRASLNEIVGQRTPEKGFLPAGAIIDGVLEPQVGGGVSQFSTTFFNAAFFAGLDFIEYQAHSLYFSRYPRGREATISWPKPDQIVENNTPYGILVWPTYTDTSITVTFYSTKNVEVQDLGRVETPQGVCTRVTTTRQRTWADGRTENDTVFAVYRPEEGINCNGERTARATEGAPPTTAPPPPPTTAPPTTAPPTTAPPSTAPPSTPAPTVEPPPSEPAETTPTG